MATCQVRPSRARRAGAEAAEGPAWPSFRLWPCGDWGRRPPPPPYKKPRAPAGRAAGGGTGAPRSQARRAPPVAAAAAARASGRARMGRYSGKTCRLLFMLVLTVAFFVAELVSGYLGIIALLSDSFNMLSDLISLCVGLSAGYIARRPRG